MQITVTGVDELTDLAMLPENVEVGVLYTATPKDRNRYMPPWAILQVLNWLHMHGRRSALHVCGKTARDSLLGGRLREFTDKVQRIQVNGVIEPWYLREVCRLHPDHTIITQHTWKNAGLLRAGEANHAVLVDGSGGRGVSPDEWDRPETDIAVGFAGGLGPHNIATQLPKIMQVAKGDWWIDMEGQIRDEDDRFDVQKVVEVVRICDMMQESLYKNDAI